MRKTSQPLAFAFFITAFGHTAFADSYDPTLYESHHANGDTALNIQASEIIPFIQSPWEGKADICFYRKENEDKREQRTCLNTTANTEWGNQTLHLTAQYLNENKTYPAKKSVNEEKAFAGLKHQVFLSPKHPLNSGISIGKNTKKGIDRDLILNLGLGYESLQQNAPNNGEIKLGFGVQHSSHEEQFSAFVKFGGARDLTEDGIRFSLTGIFSAPFEQDDREDINAELSAKVIVPLGNSPLISTIEILREESPKEETVMYFRVGIKDVCFLNCFNP